MKILILGRTSSLSKEFALYLKKKNILHKVESLDKFLKLDKKKIESFNCVINFCIHKTYLVKTYDKKYDLDFKVIEKIKNLKIKFIMLSSSKVYHLKEKISENSKKSPFTTYGKNKLITEKKVTKLIKNYLILRLSNIITRKKLKSKNSVTNTFFDIVRNNLMKKKIVFSKFNGYKDFLFFDDFCKLLLLSIKKNLKGIYNLSSNNKVELKKLAYLISKITNFKVTFNDSKTDSFILNNNKLFKKLKFSQNLKKVNLSNIKKIL